MLMLLCAARSGGRHHGLHPEYQAWLDSLKPYQPSGMQQLLGGAASGAVLLSAAAPAVPLYVAGRAFGLLPKPSSKAAAAAVDNREGGSGMKATNRSSNSSSTEMGNNSHSNSSSIGTDGLLPFLGWYMTTAQTWTWFVHDNALRPIFGSGCCTAKQ